MTNLTYSGISALEIIGLLLLMLLKVGGTTWMLPVLAMLRISTLHGQPSQASSPLLSLTVRSTWLEGL